MKTPPLQVRLMGHPVVAWPMMLVGGAMLLDGFHERNLLMGILAVAVWGAFLSANERATKYRAWKRQWDSLDAQGPAPPRRASGRRLITVAVGLVLLVGMLCSPHATAHAVGFALGWLIAHPAILAVPLLVVLGLVVRHIRRDRTATGPAALVRVVAQRTLPVPTLDAAYRALPPYCHALFGGRQ